MSVETAPDSNLAIICRATAAAGGERSASAWVEAQLVTDQMSASGYEWGIELVTLWLEQAAREGLVEKLWGADGEEYYRPAGASG